MLLPEATITRLAIDANRKLVGNSPSEIVLDETACLPLFTVEAPYYHIYTWNIPDYLDEINQGNYDAAYLINLVDNVFPGVLGRVCSRPCEDVCRHGRDGLGQPVAICFSKRAASDLGSGKQCTNTIH